MMEEYLFENEYRGLDWLYNADGRNQLTNQGLTAESSRSKLARHCGRIVNFLCATRSPKHAIVWRLTLDSVQLHVLASSYATRMLDSGLTGTVDLPEIIHSASVSSDSLTQAL